VVLADDGAHGLARSRRSAGRVRTRLQQTPRCCIYVCGVA
jgi:hypothetical protein